MPVIARDGVALHYDDAGTGDPPLLFVHGWTCDRTHFAPQIEHFSVARPGARHRCVSVDLRGHGASDAPAQEYTVESFADDVASMCDQLGVTGAVVVGHSMGGAVVLALTAARPDLVRAVVLLDPAILFPAGAEPGIRQLAESFAGADGVEALRAFESQAFFLPSSDPALKSRLLDAACRTQMHVVASAFRNVAKFDAEGALRSLGVPLMYVGAQPGFVELERLRAAAPGAIIANTAGSGHFHQLEVPDQINAMLERFLAVNGLLGGR